MKEFNFVIIISIFTISFLLLTGFVKTVLSSHINFFDSNKYFNLSDSVEYFIPADNLNLNINDLITDSATKFTKNNQSNISFPENVEEVWLKLKLQKNQVDMQTIMYIDCKYISNIDFFIPTTDGKLVLIKPKEYSIYPFIELPKDIDFNKDMYINLNWTSNAFNLRLSKDSDFYIHQSELSYFYVGNIGILLGMIIMNVILFFSSKDAKYLFHSLFTGSFLSLLYCLSGIQSSILNFINGSQIIFLGTMIVLTWVLFIYSYLDIKNNMPVLNKFFNILIGLLIFLIYISGIIPNGFTYKLVYLYIFITSICFIISVYSYFKFNIGSLYYLIGILILLSGIIMYTLASDGLLEWNIITSNAWYPASSIETLLFTLGIIKQIKTEKERNNKLQMEVVTDKLTTLHNRRYFEETVKDKIADVDISRGAVCMLLLDIDNFKKVNDTYGHDVGDSVLADTAMIIKHSLRQEDILVRWGGEEFVCILPFTNVQESIVIAEKIRTNIEKHLFKYVKKSTVSIGIAEKIFGEHFDDWFKKADEAMYKSKEGGRNRVSVYYQNGNPLEFEY